MELGWPLDKIRALVNEAGSAEQSPLSDHFVSLVNIVFGVVVVQSFSRNSNEIVHPELTTTIVGLGAVYITVVSSWWGYHRLITVKGYRYKIGWAGFSRFVSDLIIVLLYAYLLFSVEEIDKANNLVRYIVGFPILFGFYIGGGLIRRLEYGWDRDVSDLLLLSVFGALLGGIAVGYNVLYTEDVGSREWLNWIFIGIPPAMILIWRFLRIRPRGE